MSVGLVVFLLGLFGVPLWLLRWGHKLRRRSARSRAAFWGAVVGHITAAVLALTFGMIPPEAWTPDETVRGVFGFWSLLLFPLAGAALFSLTSRPTDARRRG